MKNGIGFVLALAVAGTVYAKVSVSKYSVTFDEPVTAELADGALAQFNGDVSRATLNLSNCTDEGLAEAIRKFAAFGKLYVTKSPELTSIAPLKASKFTGMELKDMPKVTDVTPLSDCAALTSLKLSQVGFAHADLSFCSGCSAVTSFSLSGPPSTFKSLAGLEKLTALKNFELSNVRGPVDLSALANFKNMRRLSLRYVDGIDLSPLCGMDMLEDLSLYGSRNLDLAQLSGCKRLKRIQIYATKLILDYGALADIRSLETVDAGLSEMHDLSWAPKLPNLKTLSLFAENYNSYAPLGKCKKLSSLTCWNMRNDVDIAQFAEDMAANGAIRQLSFADSYVKNENKLAELSGCGLKKLNLGSVNAKNKKTERSVDLAFLESLAPSLTELRLGKILAENFAAVGKCVKLTSLDASCQKGFVFEAVKNLPELRSLTVPKARKQECEEALKDRKLTVYGD